MNGYLALVLHAHLPFVRHPEHEKFLEESWLFEAVTETYLPLLRLLEGWQRDELPARLTLTLSPTLCTMLRDGLLQERCERHLAGLVELTEKEIRRTRAKPRLNELAVKYHEEFTSALAAYRAVGRDLVGAFKQFQEGGLIEIITTAATHGVLPLLLEHPASLRAQVFTACDDYEANFGRKPVGIWLPECAYAEGLDTVLQSANLRWFVTDTHGLTHAEPRPRYGVFAPVFTPEGLAAFARDRESSRQVWSRTEGYPGDARYRDFYRDIGFDLDFDYVKPYLPSPDHRGFTGVKYHRITGGHGEKDLYDPAAAAAAVTSHANHFAESRRRRFAQLAAAMDRPPLVLAPYDAELFGHWWHEGPQFLDALVRSVCREWSGIELITPGEYLRRHPTNQLARPAASSWGEEGHLRVWLNERTEWAVQHLFGAQTRMTELAQRFGDSNALTTRALKQAGRELLLAQASDWPFIIRTGTSPDYARRRVQEHLLRFTGLYEQLTSGAINEPWLAELESRDKIFPELKTEYWA